jgi:hypothetical protein
MTKITEFDRAALTNEVVTYYAVNFREGSQGPKSEVDIVISDSLQEGYTKLTREAIDMFVKNEHQSFVFHLPD